ncbi:flagellar biosynthesis protein FlhA [Lignipirellula cremea]|uniref:Flagellar biosynthesis protein FlhA n=1 Tax=Lignipirellula cremea TaxID=2528010 RepID=A0A518E2B7_9BACT|nr:flagellar biosynthesis protein FlhA [Lignipirellula cremea]QDU98238.1 Flagellar biosynthesis protein FlhA [Lignipirellula cremea]
MEFLTRWRTLILPVGIISSVLVILVPLPTMLMDLLLAANITVAVIVLLTTIYVETPLEFSVFPSMLLATTLGRLVLNVATTRLILTQAGGMKTQAAGGVIAAFGDFVAGGSIIVGIIIFVIIVVIQFVVITKGATRISEVAARFALDGMPGRQMAIDADLNAGSIDEKEAQRRREEITQQADFFGAMDGASKFVRGDAVAGIIITLINIVGGLVIGVFTAGMTVMEAAAVFTTLTIGDGLVSQVPGLLTSLAAALLVTRSSQASNLPTEFLQQLFGRPQALFVAGAFLAVLIFTNLPTIPLAALGGSCIGLAVMMTRKEKETKTQVAKDVAKEKTEAAKPPEERIEDFLTIDPMEMEIGVGLIRLADPSRGGDLLQRITGVRQSVAADIGIILPKVRIRDNMRLGEYQYRVKIANNPVAEGIVYPDRLLAMDSGMTTGEAPGEPTRDPAFGQPAVWINPGIRERAEMLGYTPVEPAAVLATHLQEIVRQHADDLLTRDDTRRLIDELKATSPAVVEELIPGLMRVGEVQTILQMLLREDVPIRQLATILEALGDNASKSKDPVLLTELVRHRLARTLCARYRDAENRLHVITLDPALEDRISKGIEHNERGLFLRMSPPAIETTNRLIAAQMDKLNRAGHQPLLLCSPQIRAGLKQLTLSQLPRLVVLSYNEITRDTRIESYGIVSDAKI